MDPHHEDGHQQKDVKNVRKQFKANLGIEPPNACKRCQAVGLCIRQSKKKQIRGIKQRWYCNRCGYRFVLNDDGFEKVGSDPEMISEAIDLVFLGLPLRKCARFLTRSHKLSRPLHNTTILKWLKKYIQLIKPYVDSLKPKLPDDIWHADEMMVNVKTAMMGKGRYMWVWNLLSSKGKFLMASLISKQREIKDARRLFAKGKIIAQGKPKEVITDLCPPYPDAFKKELYTSIGRKIIHRRYHSFERNPNNNKIEAVHGQIRATLKIRRGLGNAKSAQNFIDGLRIHRNFVNPQEGIGNITPAVKAGLDLALGSNPTLELIKQSARARDLRPEEKFKATLGKRLEYVDVIEEKECIKVKPKTWLHDKKLWKEINDILRVFDFAWLSDRKNSLWIKQAMEGKLPPDRIDAYFQD